MSEGVDYSYDPPTASELLAAGKVFAVRYGGPGQASKHLTTAEATALKAAGISLVAVAQGVGSTGLLGGAAVGAEWATLADAFFRSMGMPPGRPIYFAVDWDAQPADFPAVDAALRAAAGVIGPNRVGVYGGYRTIEHCAAVDSARWFWQSYAWSAGRLHSSTDLYQYRNGQTLGSGTVDFDRSLTGDYGQWGGAMAWTLARNLNRLRTNIRSLPAYATMTIYTIGDDLHRLRISSHNPDDTEGSLSEYTDADTNPEVRALDLMVGSIPLAAMERLYDALTLDPRSRARLSYGIFRGRIRSRSNGWVEKPHTDDPHNDHIHVSGYAPDDENGADWPAVLALAGAGGVEQLFCNYGSEGQAVKYLQRQLNRLGYRDSTGAQLTIDGNYGNSTAAAVLWACGPGANEGKYHTDWTMDVIVTKLAIKYAGPKGDKGDPGPQGEPGPPGEPGDVTAGTVRLTGTLERVL